MARYLYSSVIPSPGAARNCAVCRRKRKTLVWFSDNAYVCSVDCAKVYGRKNPHLKSHLLFSAAGLASLKAEFELLEGLLQKVETYPAQITFVEAPCGGFWSGRLLTRKDVVDTQNYNRPLERSQTPRWNIEEVGPERYDVTLQGKGRGGRRYRTFASLTAAQEAGIKWAGRRFKIVMKAPVPRRVMCPRCAGGTTDPEANAPCTMCKGRGSVLKGTHCGSCNQEVGNA
jgi:hypothetical protein